jgi:hypothetical protein
MLGLLCGNWFWSTEFLSQRRLYFLLGMTQDMLVSPVLIHRKGRLANMFFIVIAFTLNSNKYATDLQKHGVHVDNSRRQIINTRL